MSDFTFCGVGLSPLGISGRSSNTSGNVGLAGSALLPTITAKLRNEFYPLLSTLASNGSSISATYVMELLFTLIRFDAILHSDERHLLVSTSQQLITKHLTQLRSVRHKVKLLEENLTFVEELIERCAALEELCGSHNDETQDDEDVEMAATTAPDIGTAAEEEEDEDGDVGNTTNDDTQGSAFGESALCQQRQGQQQPRRLQPAQGARSALRARHRSSLSNTVNSITSNTSRRQYFSFDEDLDGMVNRPGGSQVPQQDQQQQQGQQRKEEEKRPASAAGATGGSANTFTVSSSSTPLRQRHLQRPPPLPLNLVSDTTPTAAGASAATTTQRSVTGSALRAVIQHQRENEAMLSESQLSEHCPGDVSPGAAPADDKEGATASGSVGSCVSADGNGAGASAHSTSVTPSVFTGVQHALQEHFRQNVKRTLTGTSGVTEMTPQPQNPAAMARFPLLPAQVGAVPSINNTSFGGGVGGSNNNGLYTGLVAAASANQINVLAVDEGGPLAVAPLAGGPYSSFYSASDLDPVDTARVWDRMFWGFLDGRTATADLVVLLSLLNDGNAALAALQAREKGANKRAGSESATTNTATKASGRGITSSSRLDTAARSPPATAAPTPDCGVLPLMEALKRTGSYAELLPTSVLSNVSFTSVAAAATAAASIPSGGDDGMASRTRCDRAGEATGEGEGDDDSSPQFISCTTDPTVAFPANSSISGAGVVNVRLGGGGNSAVDNYSNIDAGALRPPRQWANLDDFARAEEARLHRDFWAHIPAILVTLSEGLMYGDSHRRRSGCAPPQKGSAYGDGSSRSMRRQQQQHKRRTSAAAEPLPTNAVGEVAGAPTNTSVLDGTAVLRDSHDSQGGEEEGGEDWGNTASQQCDYAGAPASRDVVLAGDRTDNDNEDTGKEDEAADASGEADDTFVPLHPPSTEALQLLPTFSPLLRNYASAMGKLLQVAPDYARSTQAQHARAVASATAQHQQQQMLLLQQQLGLPAANDASKAGGGTSENEADEDSIATTTGSTTVSSEVERAARRGLARAATHRSSVADLHDVNETTWGYANSGDRRVLPAPSCCPGKATQPTPLPAAAATGATSPSASPEGTELGLLGDGNRNEVRPVDVVMYALVTAVYVQCALPVQHQRRLQQMAAMGGNGHGRGTALPFARTANGKASPSESSRSSAGGFSPQPGFTWPCSSNASGMTAATTALSGMSFAGDGTDDDRTLNLSLANGSLSYNAHSAPGNVGGGGSAAGWWNANVSGGVGGGRGFLPSNTSFGMTPHVLRPTQPQFTSVYGGTRYDNASFTAPQPHVPNLSFDLSVSPTEAALSFLRCEHAEKASGGACGSGKKGEGKTGGGTSASPTHATPLAMYFPTQDVLACANAFSWVSLPSIMKAELQNLKAQLQATRNAVQRMEGQVRGELALLLFRVLSMVLDWLMPAVYVADPRIWLFYRKWCCDLYRVLCTDLALLDEFRTLLNQSGVAAIAATPGREAEAKRPHAKNPTAISATTTPTCRPLRSDSHQARSPSRPTALPDTPVTSSEDSRDIARSPRDAAEDGNDRQGTTVGSFPKGVAERSTDAGSDAEGADLRGGGSSDGGNDAHDSRKEEDEEELFDFILPGSSLAVSVAHATPPVRPGVLNLLAQEEADRRGEALADMASLRAAQALLSDEGKVIPLPKPFLITKLVAAALRGIDPDIAESLLWVVGLGTEATHKSAEERARTAATLRSAAADDPNVFLHHPASLQGGDAALGDSSTSGNNNNINNSSSHGAAADNVHSTSQWKSQRPRHGSRTSSGHPLRTSQHSNNTSNNADSRRKSCGLHREVAAAAPGVGGSQFDDPYLDGDDDSDDSNDVQRLDRRYGGSGGGATRTRWCRDEGGAHRRGSRQPPASAQSPVMAGPASSGGTLSRLSSTAMFPTMTPLTPFTDVPMSGSPPLQYPGMNQQQQQQPPASQTAAAAAEGPMLVHHHRFRYPSVNGYADVAQLYLSTLEDAELLLSPHDPIYASLVLSAADLHLHDLHDRGTAAILVDSYLADVGEEHIQTPIWDALPTSVVPVDSTGNPAAAAATTTTASPSAGASLTPGRSFSVTRVRQGNTGGVAGLTFTSGVAAQSSSSSTSPPARLPAPQQPYVPMVIPSWNNERERNEFLGTLRVLRQIQVFLTEL
jgi:hypothetical protein